MRRFSYLFPGGILLSLFLAQAAIAASPNRPAAGPLPIVFEANQGQVKGDVSYVARTAGSMVYLTRDEAVLALSSGSSGAVLLRLQLAGANPGRQFDAEGRLGGVSNYLATRDPRNWHVRIPQYARITLRQVYPGIDLVYHGSSGRLEYDFRVKPGADAASIALRIAGADAISVAPNGDLVIRRGEVELVQQAPVVFQTEGGRRVLRSGHFVIRPDRAIGFEVGAYDHTRELVIDPVLEYSTYLGGSYGGTDPYFPTGSSGMGIAVDQHGSAYIVGRTFDVDFPTTPGALQTSCPGGIQYCAVRPVLFVTKLNPGGTEIVYSTYLTSGYGTGFDVSSGKLIAVDGKGNAHIAGTTFGGQEGEFPISSSAFEQTCPFETDATCAFYTVLSPDGSQLVYSTYYGKAFPDIRETTGTALALDRDGNAYLTGYTEAYDIPITPGAFQQNFAGGQLDAFVAKFNPKLSGAASLVYATYLGGSGDDMAFGVAVDRRGDAYVTGITTSEDFPHQRTFGNGTGGSFLVKLNAAGTKLRFSDLLRGVSATSIALDRAGHAYLAGGASANSLRRSGSGFGGGPYDAFVARFNPAGTTISKSAYLGGSGPEFATGIALNGKHQIVITGETSSSDFPVTAGATQSTPGGANDAFATVLSSSGLRVQFSTYLGGSGEEYGADVATDLRNAIYITGRTGSLDFPITTGAVQGENRSPGGSAFITKIAPQ